jgi:iron complex transport system substrate-binding protein
LGQRWGGGGNLPGFYRFKGRLILLLLLLSLLLLPACGASAPTAVPEAVGGGAISFIDALGHEVTVERADKVIAASGSLARIWLLAGGNLIGTTRDAWNEGADLGPEVTDIGSLHSPSVEQILALEPDLLILSGEISGHVQLYGQLAAAGVNTAYFSVEVLAEYLNMLHLCTQITGRDDLYQRYGEAVQEQVAATIAACAGEAPPQILLLRSSSVNTAARNSSTMAGAMLRDLGAVNIADQEAGLLDNLSLEVIIDQDPTFIFVILQGDSEEKALANLAEKLQTNPAWANLSAVKNDRYFILPKDLFHLKPNERWGESYARLADILYGK